MQHLHQGGQRLKGIALPVMPVGERISQGKGALTGHDHDLPCHLPRRLQRHSHHAGGIGGQHIAATPGNELDNPFLIPGLAPLIPGADFVVPIVEHGFRVLGQQVTQGQTFRFQKNHGISLLYRPGTKHAASPRGKAAYRYC